MEWINSCTSAETAAPAVGNILGFIRPNSLRTRLSMVLFINLYLRARVKGGRFPLLRYSILCLYPITCAFRKIFCCQGVEWSILSLTAIYTFSQNRGTEHILVGCVSRMD